MLKNGAAESLDAIKNLDSENLGFTSRSDLLLRLEKARKETSVVAVNEQALAESRQKSADFLCFGVKDTGRFPTPLFDRVRADKNYLWLTVDRMADKGRSIDTGLVNPLTYRPMTGSTSGGAVNILLGINDFALGSDGGGSVLAPALACQLPSFIGAGLDFFLDGDGSVSTDGLMLKPSVGAIGRSLEILEKVLATFRSGEGLPPVYERPALKVAIPEAGCLLTPTGEDMAKKLAPFIRGIEDRREMAGLFRFQAVGMKGAEDRKKGVDLCRSCFEKGFDLILTYEGPVDVLGYGETIPSAFGGVGPELAKRGGKFLVKAANPFGATALTVPSNELASGFVVLAPAGVRAAAAAFCLAKALASAVTLPEVFVRYFLTRERLQQGFKLPL